MPTTIVYIAMLAIALAATITDTRTGRIPNWLTLPTLLLAPTLHFALGGTWAGCSSLLGAVLCGSVPLVMFYMGAMGGGDVKVFAALGALGGPQMGLEIELASMSVAFGYGLILVTWRGGLLTLLANSARIAANLVLPKTRRFEIAVTELTTVRIGAAIFAGTALCVANQALSQGFI